MLALAVPFRLLASASSTARQPESLATSVAAPQALDYRRIAAANGPAVVGIDASVSTHATMQSDGTLDLGADITKFSPNDPFFRFFRDLPIPHTIVRADLMGSGFIVSSDGVVLTNAHLVRDASAVSVMLADRRKFQARVVGIDPMLDVAVLRVDTPHLPRSGSETRARSPSATRCSPWAIRMISRKTQLPESSVRSAVRLSRIFIQTDIALHFGNSGGPLLDSEGRVVGINAQIYTSSEGYQGVTYAIPINVAMSVESEVARVDRRTHLDRVESSTPSALSVRQCPYTNGTHIAHVAPDSNVTDAGAPARRHVPVIHTKHQQLATEVSTL